MKRSKLQYAQTAVGFIGHDIGRSDRDGVAVLKSRVAAVRAIKPPQDAKAIRNFLDVVKYVSKFILNCAQKSALLRALVRTGENFT